MDGDPVAGEPSDAPQTLTDAFIAMCPFYLEMGMSYNDYWHRNTSVHKAYRDAYELRKRNNEWARHRQGEYVLQALAVALQCFSKDKSQNVKYPTKPWPLTERDAREREEREAKARYMNMREKLLAESKQAQAKKQEGQKEAVEDGRRSED